MSLNDICANTLFIDKHIQLQDEAEAELETIYSHATNLFKEDLESDIVKEDIEDDLIFEIKVEIERLAYNVSADEVLKSIFNDFNIKGAK